MAFSEPDATVGKGKVLIESDTGQLFPLGKPCKESDVIKLLASIGEVAAAEVTMHQP